MLPSTKTLLKRGAAVLALAAVAGGAYVFSSNGASFQASLLSQDVVTLPVIEATGDGSQTVGSIFDATPTASLSETGSILTQTGETMSGILLTNLTDTAVETVADEVRELENLRPAASEQAGNLLGALGFGNENQNVTVGSAATTLNMNSNVATNANSNAATALQNAPRVPQTGPESWLLIAAIMCASMGMMMLLTPHKL